jgi:hypothetical protein
MMMIPSSMRMFDVVVVLSLLLLLIFPLCVTTFVIGKFNNNINAPNVDYNHHHQQHQHHNSDRSRGTYEIRQSKALVVPVPQLLCCCNENNHEFVTSIPTTAVLSSNVAADVLDSYVLPVSEKGYRMNLFVPVSDNNDAFVYDDSTYGEFPLSSLDIVLDRVEELICTENLNSNVNQRRRRLKVVDIGSGCGRLVLYMAMTRSIQYHEIIGIEQMECYYNESIVATKRLLQHLDNNGHKTINCNNNGTHEQLQADSTTTTTTSTTSIALYCGYASNYLCQIHSADIIICYSTAFSSSYFSEAISALILSNEWNTILTPITQTRTTNTIITQSSTSTTAMDLIPNKVSSLYCITIDKALDPLRGWTLMERINVPNPEVGCDSTVFIQKI